MKKIIIISLVAFVGLGVGLTSVFAVTPFPKRIDFVNIGLSSSESGHNLQGWGPIEPATNGGNWGQIGSEVSGADCGLPDGESCDKALRVTYSGNNPAESDSPDMNGRSAYITLRNSHPSWLGLGLKKVRMRVLDGIADDDFMVFVKNKNDKWVLAYEYNSDPSAAEVWKIHEFNLPIRYWLGNKPVELRIMSTASNWSQFAVYGQLGIDWIELLGGPHAMPSTDNHESEED